MLSLVVPSPRGSHVKSGVPQGSVLGPLFFLSYVNDLAFISFSHGTQILLFADDIILYKPVSNDQDTIDFQADVDVLANWAKLNHLELNNLIQSNTMQ